MHFSAPNLLLCYQQTHLVITAPSDATLARAAARLMPPVAADACFALRRERELDDGTRAGCQLAGWGAGGWEHVGNRSPSLQEGVTLRRDTIELGVSA